MFILQQGWGMLSQIENGVLFLNDRLIKFLNARASKIEGKKANLDVKILIG